MRKSRRPLRPRESMRLRCICRSIILSIKQGACQNCKRGSAHFSRPRPFSLFRTSATQVVRTHFRQLDSMAYRSILRIPATYNS